MAEVLRLQAPTGGFHCIGANADDSNHCCFLLFLPYGHMNLRIKDPLPLQHPDKVLATLRDYLHVFWAMVPKWDFI